MSEAEPQEADGYVTSAGDAMATRRQRFVRQLVPRRIAQNNDTIRTRPRVSLFCGLVVFLGDGATALDRLLQAS